MSDLDHCNVVKKKKLLKSKGSKCAKSRLANLFNYIRPRAHMGFQASLRSECGGGSRGYTPFCLQVQNPSADYLGTD